MKLCLVCSSGGHFMEMQSLRLMWEGYDRFWVTFPTEDTRSFLGDERKYWAYFPTNRNLRNFFRNFLLALRVLLKERPEVIVTTGAAVAVPFVYAGKILGITTIYVESLTRVKELSLSGKLVYSFADHLLVQWPKIRGRYPRTCSREG